jgi:hypothetical protein
MSDEKVRNPAHSLANVQEYDPNVPNSDFTYGHNVNSTTAGDQYSNVYAGYWFGIFYVLFYLLDTFTNVPYEALGPEMHPDPEVRTGGLLPRQGAHMFDGEHSKFTGV